MKRKRAEFKWEAGIVTLLFTILGSGFWVISHDAEVLQAVTTLLR